MLLNIHVYNDNITQDVVETQKITKWYYLVKKKGGGRGQREGPKTVAEQTKYLGHPVTITEWGQ